MKTDLVTARDIQASEQRLLLELSDLKSDLFPLKWMAVAGLAISLLILIRL